MPKFTMMEGNRLALENNDYPCVIIHDAGINFITGVDPEDIWSPENKTGWTYQYLKGSAHGVIREIFPSIRAALKYLGLPEDDDTFWTVIG